MKQSWESKIAPAAPFSGAPRITAPLVYGASPNLPILWRVGVLGERPVRLEADGLPDGLVLRENVISGSAPAGEYPVTLRAHSRLGSDEKTVTLRVAPDGALRTPLLGFTSWNAFASGVTQADIESTAELLVRTGLAEYGYTYVNLDSGWQGAYGGAYDAVQPNAKFPNMRAMYDALHRLGLKGGIYSSPFRACWGCPPEQKIAPGATRGEPDIRFGDMNTGIGTEHRESENVRQWAEWGVDYLKYDWRPTDPVNADRMKSALRAAPREIPLCVTVNAVPEYALYWNHACCSWRNNNDTVPSWQNIAERLATVDDWIDRTSPGHFYDLDMLAIGEMALFSDPKEAVHQPWRTQTLTEDEQIFAMTMHLFFPSPVQLSMRLDRLTPFTFALVANEELLAINQDAQCSFPVRDDLPDADCRIYRRAMADGGWTVAVFNLSASVQSGTYPLGGDCRLRDPWRKADLGIADKIVFSLPPHSAAVRRVRPV